MVTSRSAGVVFRLKITPRSEVRTTSGGENRPTDDFFENNLRWGVRSTTLTGGVPQSWPSCFALPWGSIGQVFHDLRAEGGFLVSGARENNRVEFVHVRSTVATGKSQLRLLPRMAPGFRVLCNGVDSCNGTTRHADGSVTLSFFAANDTALLMPAGATQATVAPAASEEEYHNWWGCEEGRSAGH